MVSIVEATRDFEGWLARQTAVVRTQFVEKHSRMAESPFAFLRRTIYRWSQVWPEVCPELAAAPRVLAIGDLHGIADFHGACRSPEFPGGAELRRDTAPSFFTVGSPSSA